jgi:peptidoglycan hydrolase-like protein with peptidoglycan-binding domain
VRQAVQRHLRDKGLYSGDIDGEFGPQTISALEAFAGAGQGI